MDMEVINMVIEVFVKYIRGAAELLVLLVPSLVILFWLKILAIRGLDTLTGHFR